MGEFFTGVWEYLKSADYNAVLTSVLAGVAVFMPIINKIIKVRTNARLELAKTKAEAVSKELEAYAENTKALQEQVLQLIESGESQAKAFKLAFDRSNLKEDVKSEISRLLDVPAIAELKGQVAKTKTAVADVAVAVAEVVEETVEPVVEAVEKVSNFIRDIA